MRPDAFGFYRPVTQASLAVDARAPRQPPVAGACVQCRCARARHRDGVYRGASGAGVAAWCRACRAGIRADAESTVDRRALDLGAGRAADGAVLARRRSRRGSCGRGAAARGGWPRPWPLTGSRSSSKETATLLPVLLLFDAADPSGRSRSRAGAVAGFIVLALVIYVWRSQTGALTPFAGDAHYSPAISSHCGCATRPTTRDE